MTSRRSDSPLPSTVVTEPQERALLVGITAGGAGRAEAEASLEELGLLAQTAGASVVGSLLQERPRRDPATLIGRGKVADVARLSEERDADLLLFDDELSPAQQRNLEEAVGRKTLDRTQLILDIFARRARTREGRLQVELAQLDYLLPRLTGQGRAALAARRRHRHPRTGRDQARDGPAAHPPAHPGGAARDRAGAARPADAARRRADARAAPIVALVGYTNAGKSTLFSRPDPRGRRRPPTSSS